MDMKDIKFKKLEKDTLYHVIVENATEEDIVMVSEAIHAYSEEQNLGIKDFISDERIKFIKIEKDATYIVEADGASDDAIKMITNQLKQGEFKNTEFKVTNLHVTKE